MALAPPALQDTQVQPGCPRPAAPASPPPPPLPLPLAADSINFAVPPSIHAALDVLAAQHPITPKAARADASGGHVSETAAACAAGLRRWAGWAARMGSVAGHAWLSYHLLASSSDSNALKR